MTKKWVIEVNDNFFSPRQAIRSNATQNWGFLLFFAMRVDIRLCLFRSAVLLRRSLQKQIVRIKLNLYANKHERVGEKIKPARPRDVDGKRSPRLAQGFLFLIQQFSRRHFQLEISKNIRRERLESYHKQRVSTRELLNYL